MIKMNPKFKSKIKEMIKNGNFTNTDGILSMGINSDFFNPVSTTVIRELTNIIYNNKGFLKLSDNIYLKDDIMCYINDETKEYYVIPESEHKERLAFIAQISFLEIGLKLRPIIYLDNTKLNDLIKEVKSKNDRIFGIKNLLLSNLRESIKGHFISYLYDTSKQPHTYQDVVNDIMEVFIGNNKFYQDFVNSKENTPAVKEIIRDYLYKYTSYYTVLLIEFYFYIQANEDKSSLSMLNRIFLTVNASTNFEYIDTLMELTKDELDEKSKENESDNTLDSPNITRLMYNVLNSKFNTFQLVWNAHQLFISEFKGKKNSRNILCKILPINFFECIKGLNNIPELGLDAYYLFSINHQKAKYIPINPSIEYQEEKYTSFLSSPINADLLCTFLTDKWKNEFYFDKMSNLEVTSKDRKTKVELLSRSFKSIGFLIPADFSLSANTFVSYLSSFHMTILDPKTDDDEDVLNRFFFDGKQYYPSPETFDTLYNLVYDRFRSGESKFALINRGGIRFLIDLYNLGVSIGQPFGVYTPIPNIEKLPNPEYIPLYALIMGSSVYDTLGVMDEAFYHSTYAQKHQAGESVYFISALMDYLSAKQQDGSIELHLVEVEETKNKKRNSSSFTVHERKSSWVRAHYRHYKSGVVTLVTAHARKGCNSVNNKLILNL